MTQSEYLNPGRGRQRYEECNLLRALPLPIELMAVTSHPGEEGTTSQPAAPRVSQVETADACLPVRDEVARACPPGTSGAWTPLGAQGQGGCPGARRVGAPRRHRRARLTEWRVEKYTASSLVVGRVIAHDVK